MIRNTKQIQNKYITNTKQIQNKYKTNTKLIQNKYKTNTKQVQNKYKYNAQPWRRRSGIGRRAEGRSGRSWRSSSENLD